MRAVQTVRICGFAFLAVIAVCVSSDVQATARGSCKRTSVNLPPGDYSIVVAGSDDKDIAAAIKRVVLEELQSRPDYFQNSKIEVYDGITPIPKERNVRASARIVVGNSDAILPRSEGEHLSILVPRIYENSDPKYVRLIKLQSAGVHLAFRSLLFFSGEAKETLDKMNSEHFSSLPDEFGKADHNGPHR
jgi:hypothetical protein